MNKPVSAPRRRGILRWLKSTSNRTFAVYPLAIAAVEALLRQGDLVIEPAGIPFLIWGYLQYRLCGNYRLRLGGGGPGLEVPPDRIVAEGPYRYLRNPMYLGHLIFITGLVITFQSWAAGALLGFSIVWFHRRVVGDEAHLLALFGEPYRDYQRRVKRWIPGVL